jgi:hypothetical protein
LKYNSLSFKSSTQGVGSINFIFRSGPGYGGIAAILDVSTFSLLLSNGLIINIFFIGLSNVMARVLNSSLHHSSVGFIIVLLYINVRSFHSYVYISSNAKFIAETIAVRPASTVCNF